MTEKFIISSVLTDLTSTSKTKFIEAKDNEDLIKLAKSKGIILPSPDLACFESYYCELDKPNLNNAMLTKKAAEEGINSLIGKQINLNHQGKNYVIGYTIDAKIKDEMVIVTGILFKSLFPDEFDEIKQLFEEGKLFLSFELWNREPETGESIIEMMDNGVKKITKMIAHGVGLLLRGVKPACKRAQVFKLLANQKDNGEQIFQEDDRFAYASFSNEVVECKHCNPCTCEQDKEVQKVEEIKLEEILENDYEGGEIEEAKKLTTEQRNALPDDDFALIQEKDGKKIRRFPINDEAHVRNALARLPQAKDMTEEERKTCMEKILKKAKELNMEDIVKKHEKAEEVIEPPAITEETKPAEVAGTETKPVEVQAEVAPVELPKVVKITTEETVSTIEIPNETGNSVERKGSRKCTRVYSDGKEEVSTEEFTVVDTYSLAQLEEKVNVSNEETIAAMPKEVSDRIKELMKDGKSMKEAMKQAWDEYKSKADLETSDLKTATENLDKEIKKLQDELGKKDQEIAELKTPKVEEKKEKEMTVGAVEGEKQTEIKRQAAEVNKIIASKRDKK